MLVSAALRIAGSITVLVALYYVLPLEHSPAWGTITILVIGLVIFIGLVALQTRSILRSPFPGLRAIESLATSVPLFLLLFASTYVVMAAMSAGNFGERLTHTDGLYLRADTMHGFYCYLEENPGRGPERFHELSHGEGFLEILRTRVNQPGFYLMDEPDAPLSFTSCLGLVALLHDLAQAGSQAVIATHSPIVAAVPGATILELGDWGMRPARWEELHIVGAWRRFLAEPASYVRHLLAD